MRKILPITLLAIVFCIPSAQAGHKPKGITQAEMAMIPQYCPDTMGFNYGDAYNNTSPRAAHWVAMLGKDFWNLHHYCWARINLLRAKRHGATREERKSLLLSVLDDYQYVLDKAAPDFILLPEILTRAGEVELMLSRPDRADTAFTRARQLKPDYWPAYSHWIEYLISKGRHSEAKDLAKEGLGYAPRSTTLQKQYRLLGGNPAEIVPQNLVPSPQFSEDNEGTRSESPPNDK